MLLLYQLSSFLPLVKMHPFLVAEGIHIEKDYESILHVLDPTDVDDPILYRIIYDPMGFARHRETWDHALYAAVITRFRKSTYHPALYYNLMREDMTRFQCPDYHISLKIYWMSHDEIVFHAMEWIRQVLTSQTEHTKILQEIYIKFFEFCNETLSDILSFLTPAEIGLMYTLCSLYGEYALKKRLFQFTWSPYPI